MPVELLLEIGTEEIPSGYLEGGLKDLKRLTETTLKDKRILVSGEIKTYCTPRRLVLYAGGIAEKQEDTVLEVIGPPKKAAYDKDGNPTKAAVGFAGKYSMNVVELGVIETPKGEYLQVKKEITGLPTKEILPEIFTGLISGISWPKSMRWGSVGFQFVRPIHWILALFGGELISFEVAGIKSGNKTMGHRFMASGTIEIIDAEDYFKKLKNSFVMINQEERERFIKKEIAEKAEEISGIPVDDPELVSTNANLVEYPSAVCGSFDKEFLNLPDQVLITAMREHQKYFAVQDNTGNLMPNFIAINNTIAGNDSVVRKGHERVLRARLSDAVFFFNEDRKRPLEDRLHDLRDVIYQAELGTSFSKVERFTALAQYLAEQISPEKKDDITLAARLCKCDLVTEMVMEFPSLQGIMGKEYAFLDGHKKEVCQAIYEHYLPAKAGDVLPDSITGAVISLADRMDTIGGCFAIGLEPTGATDPFALRRHALAIIRILEIRGWEVSLSGFISRGLKILSENVNFDSARVYNNILNFFRDRYKNKMLAAGYESDLIEAIVSARFDKISELPARIDQLKRFTKESDEFQSLALTFKRVSNILKNQEDILDVNPGLFADPAESVLWDTYMGLKDEIHLLTEKKKYFEALNILSGLRKPVDTFFDSVEVLIKEHPAHKNNRVAILNNISKLFMGLADFSKFSI